MPTHLPPCFILTDEHELMSTFITLLFRLALITMIPSFRNKRSYRSDLKRACVRRVLTTFTAIAYIKRTFSATRFIFLLPSGLTTFLLKLYNVK